MEPQVMIYGNTYNFQSKRELLFHVGIRYEFIAELENLESWVWEHELHVKHLQSLIKRNMRDMEMNHIKHDKVEDFLYGLGFIRERAQVLANWIGSDAYTSHQTVFYFANIYIENTLTHNLSTCAKVKPLFYTPASTQDTIVLFHSTTRASARHIADNGIRADIGEARQDFSHNGGFYLTDNLEYAVKWAELRSYGTDPALLVYTIPRKVIALFKGLHLIRECLTDMSLWKKIIEYNHGGREESNDKMDYLFKAFKPDDKDKYQKHVDYIMGPVSLYGGVSMFANVNQLCILTQHMADALSINDNKYLHQMYEWGGRD